MPFRKIYDFAILNFVLQFLFSKALDGGYFRDELKKIPSLVRLVKETYPDRTTLSQSDFDKRFRIEVLKIVDQCPLLL